jgi:hypothetical protein
VTQLPDVSLAHTHPPNGYRLDSRGHLLQHLVAMHPGLPHPLDESPWEDLEGMHRVDHDRMSVSPEPQFAQYVPPGIPRVIDLTGRWTPALMADSLYAAVREAQASGRTTVLTSDNAEVARVIPAPISSD